MTYLVLPEPRVDRAIAGCPHARAAVAALAPERLPPDVQAWSAVRFLPPPADLAPVVEYLWQLVLPAAPGAVWRVVVDGYLDLSVRFPLGTDLLRAASTARGVQEGHRAVVDALAAGSSVVCGAASVARGVPMSVPQLLTGVRFRMGAAAAVLRSSAAELMDGARPLDAVVRRRTSEHAAAALASGARDAAVHPSSVEGAQEMVLALARAGVEEMARRLVARAAHPAGARPGGHQVRHALYLLDHATPAGSASAGTVVDVAARVATVASAMAVSTRSLERLFLQNLGFAPRTYQTLRRVGAVARALRTGAPRTEPRR